MIFEEHTSTHIVILFHEHQNNIALDEFEPSTTVLLHSLSPRPQGSVYSIYIVVVSIFSIKLVQV
jgi:kynurenine formamidase